MRSQILSENQSMIVRKVMRGINKSYPATLHKLLELRHNLAVAIQFYTIFSREFREPRRIMSEPATQLGSRSNLA